jgi:hypothetical protein
MRIDAHEFGRITIDGAVYEHDVVVESGRIRIALSESWPCSFPTNLEANRRHAPRYEVVLMKGVGHYPMLEQPAAFNDLLAGVLPDFPRDQGRTR